MRFLVLVVLCVTHYLLLAQQDSKIKFDSSNNNEITIKQMGGDSTQKSDVELVNSDSNKLDVGQMADTKSKTETNNKKPDWRDNVNVVAAIIGIVSIITAASFWKQLKNFFKKRSNHSSSKQK